MNPLNSQYFAITLLVIILLALSEVPAGQNRDRPQWDDLQAGPYEIGFRVIHTFDYSRGYWPLKDFRGLPTPHEAARPMQISIWYPATENTGAQQMVFGDYVDLLASELGPDHVTEQSVSASREQLRQGPLNPYYPGGIDDQQLMSILNTPVPVTKNARPASGNFPLVIHAGFGLIGQSILMEYLASHGYVVVTFPVLSTHPTWYNRGEGTMEWFQAVSDDIGFAYGEMRSFRTADRTRTAVIGMLAASGFLFQMQNMQLSAIASLDGQYPDPIRKAPGFDLNKIRIPVLDMPSINNANDRSMLDSMRFSERYIVRFDSVQHREFYQFRRIAHPGQSASDIPYKTIAQYARAFLDAVLKDDQEASNFLQKVPEDTGVPRGFMSLWKKSAIPAVPTENEFLLLLRENKIDEARNVFSDTHRTLPGFPLCTESSLRTVALFFRRDHGAASSIELFRLWADMFPNSWEARYRLGTTFEQADMIKSAMKSYRDAIPLIGQDAALSEDQKKSYAQEINRRINHLRK